MRLAHFALEGRSLIKADPGLLWVVAAIVLGFCGENTRPFWENEQVEAYRTGGLFGALSVHLWLGYVLWQFGDLREAQGFWSVFGERTPEIAISATKSLTGHLMGAAGAFEGVATVLSVYHQCAPATLNFRDEYPEIKLDVVAGGSRPMQIRYAISDNIGLGGHNGAVIFKRYDGD